MEEYFWINRNCEARLLARWHQLLWQVSVPTHFKFICNSELSCVSIIYTSSTLHIGLETNDDVWVLTLLSDAPMQTEMLFFAHLPVFRDLTYLRTLSCLQNSMFHLLLLYLKQMLNFFKPLVVDFLMICHHQTMQIWLMKPEAKSCSSLVQSLWCRTVNALRLLFT